jgi:hypothetical protein
VTKGNLVATSLVGAIPGAALAYLTIMAFIHFADRMATMLQVVTGTALVCSVAMALSPFAILLFMKSGTAEETEAETKPAAAAAKAPAAVDVEAVDVDDALDEGEAPAAADGTDEDADMSLSGFDESLDETSDEAFEFDDEAFGFDEDEGKK